MSVSNYKTRDKLHGSRVSSHSRSLKLSSVVISRRKKSSAMNQAAQKNTIYVGGSAEEVNESILHASFIPFCDIKDVKTPLDQATQKHRSFEFVTFLEREDAGAAMDNMNDLNSTAMFSPSIMRSPNALRVVNAAGPPSPVSTAPFPI